MEKFDRNLTADEIRALVGDSPIMLELRCHAGYDTLAFLAAMPGIRIWSFDFDPRALAAFQALVQDDRSCLVAAAVSNRDGFAPAYISHGTPPGPVIVGDWSCSSSILPPTPLMVEIYPWLRFDPPRMMVPTVRLDTWLEQSNVPKDRPIDFVWADLQGSERFMIEGAPKALERIRYLYLEIGTGIYEGEADLAGLQSLLPDFDLLADYAQNALFLRKGG